MPHTRSTKLYLHCLYVVLFLYTLTTVKIKNKKCFTSEKAWFFLLPFTRSVSGNPSVFHNVGPVPQHYDDHDCVCLNVTPSRVVGNVAWIVPPPSPLPSERASTEFTL